MNFVYQGLTIVFFFTSFVVKLASLNHLWTEDYYPRATLSLAYLIAGLITWERIHDEP